jgi:hypothetical protein
LKLIDLGGKTAYLAPIIEVQGGPVSSSVHFMGIDPKGKRVLLDKIILFRSFELSNKAVEFKCEIVNGQSDLRIESFLYADVYKCVSCELKSDYNNLDYTTVIQDTQASLPSKSFVPSL